MEIATTTLILVGVAVLGGYVALRRLSEKLDDIREDVRQFAKMEADDAAKREASNSRRLGRIEGLASSTHEGLQDLREHQESR